MALRLEGAYTAMVTPFQSDGSLDVPGLAKNAEYQIRNGISGLVVLGTTGESPTVTAEERTRCIRTVVEAARGRVPVIIGVGTNCTRESVEYAREAERLGADGLLIVTPYYNKPTQEGIYQHFRAIAEATPLPAIVYNIAGRTSCNIETATLLRLAALENVVAVKEASGSLPQMMDVLSRVPEGFSVLSGDDAFAFPLTALGGQGVISVASNLVPGMVSTMVRTALAGDFEEARRMHFELYPLFTKMFVETNPIPIKTAMNMAGMAAGELRLPLCPLSAVHEPAIRELVIRYGAGYDGESGNGRMREDGLAHRAEGGGVGEVSAVRLR